ncbi:MAG: ribosome maturation factor RimP [Bdellovibrionales bacterium]|nr:ribosome maturation factor RimP [Bdellovibrionales bacterium]
MERIRRYAEEVAAREGCLLYDLEFREGPGRTLRVFIDKEPGGVSIDDCVNVSKGLNLRLDVEDAVPGGAYDLEVSSPGLDRKLTQFWHYEKAVGKTVQVKYWDESRQTRSYEGLLVAAGEGLLSFENSKGPFSVKFENVQKGRVVLVDALPKKPAPGKKKR